MNVRPRPDSIFIVQSYGVNEFLRFPHEKTEGLVYDHQKTAVLEAQKMLSRSEPDIALVVLPTGCGKTGVAVLAAYALGAKRVLVVTPSVKISEQIYEAFCGSTRKPMFLLERGIIKPEQVENCKPTAVLIKNAREISDRVHDSLMIINAHKVTDSKTASVSIEDMPTHYDLVIVDEAHHYPALTWRNLIDHFPKSQRLFLTATPEHRGKPILPDLKDHTCFSLSRKHAEVRGIIRPIEFFDGPFRPDIKDIPQLAIAITIMECLDRHESNKSVLKRFDAGEFRGLVVVGKLREGYDNKRVSVIGIARNVKPSSTVLFAQFVGRAVRKLHREDPITATIISHPFYNQRRNFNQFDKLREGEDIEEDED